MASISQVRSAVPDASRLCDKLAEYATKTKIPGIAACIHVDGQKVEASVGRLDSTKEMPLLSNARFEIGCIIKLLISFVAVRLHKEGKLDLHSPVCCHLPEFRSGDPLKDSIVCLHLLSHSSGLSGLDINCAKIRLRYDWTDFTEHFQNEPLQFLPGEVFNYELVGHVILGKILEKITGRGALELVREFVFSPLGIEPGSVFGDRKRPERCVANHRFSWDDQKFSPVPIPSVYSKFWAPSLSDITLTASDLCLIGAFFNTKLKAESEVENISAFFCKRAISLPRTFSNIWSERRPEGFNLGCADYGHGMLGHNGSGIGQTCALRFNSERAVSVAVAINAWLAHARDSLIADLLNDLTDAFPSPIETYDMKKLAGPFETNDLAGLYGNALGTIAVAHDGNELQFAVKSNDGKSFCFSICPDPAGKLMFHPAYPFPSVGFFPDSQNRGPYLSFGVQAYKKLTDRHGAPPTAKE